MEENKNTAKDNTQYVRNLARRAFRNTPKFEDIAIQKIEEEFAPKKNPITKSGLPGLSIGLAIGVIVCIIASFIGIPLAPTENFFIAAQFAILGALMSYLHS
jgi:hypothetical protein